MILNQYKSAVSRELAVLGAYLLLPYLFYALGVDLTETVLSPGDGFNEGYAKKVFLSTSSLWNPYSQGGISALIDPCYQIFYPPSLFFMGLAPSPLGYNMLQMLHYSLAGWFTYQFLKTLTLNGTAAFIGGLCFMFCGFMTSHKSHQPMVNAVIWLPPILLFIEKYFHSPTLSHLFLAALCFALCVLAGYPAVVVYTSMVVSSYLGFKIFFDANHPGSYSARLLRLFFSVLMVLGIGALLSAVFVTPLFESLKFITREKITYDFFCEYPFPIYALPLLIFPYLLGSGTPGFYPVAYFGPWNLTEISGYTGVAPLVLALLAAILWRNTSPQILYWSLIAMAGFVLTLGDFTPLYKLMYHVPLYNMFRVPARNWFEVHFAVAVLAAFSIHELSTNRPLGAREYKGLWGAAAVLAGVALTALGLSWMLPTMADPSIVRTNEKLLAVLTSLDPRWQLRPDFFIHFLQNLSLNSPTLYVPLALISTTCAMLVAAPFCNRKKSFWALMALLVFLDLFSFGAFHENWYPNAAFADNKHLNPTYDFLSRAESDLQTFRIWPLDDYNYDALSPSLNVVCGIPSINGYGPILLKSYQRMTSCGTSGYCSDHQALLTNPATISAFSCKYLITADENKKKLIESVRAERNHPVVSRSAQLFPEAPASDATEGRPHSNPLYLKRFEKDQLAIYENLDFLPRARFVEKVRRVSDVAEARRIFGSDPFYLPSQTALVEGDLEGMSFEPGSVLRARYDNDRLEFTVKSGRRGFLVVSDTWYPGWRAYVDGKRTTIHRTNGMGRGIVINGKGRHEVRFVFKPKSYRTGLAVSSATLCFILCYFVILPRRNRRVRRDAEQG